MGDIVSFPLGGAQREGRIVDRGDAERYLLAGRASFTLVSTRTDRRLTFAVRALASRPGLYALIGAGEMLGTLEAADPPRLVIAASADRHALALGWFLRKLLNERTLSREVELWHDGRCARCRALLTTPWALARGLDPDCAAVLAAGKAG